MKTIDQYLQEGLKQIEDGTFGIEIDSPEIIIRDPKNFEKRVTALRRLNGLPDKPLESTGRTKSNKADEVSIRVSKSTYTRLSKKAKRANMDVTEILEKLAGE